MVVRGGVRGKEGSREGTEINDYLGPISNPNPTLKLKPKASQTVYLTICFNHIFNPTLVFVPVTSPRGNCKWLHRMHVFPLSQKRSPVIHISECNRKDDMPPPLYG